MMEQPTFADVEYESKKRRTRREVFLEPWSDFSVWRSVSALVCRHCCTGPTERQEYFEWLSPTIVHELGEGLFRAPCYAKLGLV